MRIRSLMGPPLLTLLGVLAAWEIAVRAVTAT